MSEMAQAKPTENASQPNKRQDLEVLTALDTAKTQLYHFKAIVIAGMGFFTDAYDLFCIAAVAKLLGRIYYYDENIDKPGVLPPGPYFAVTGVALFGTLAGQLFFGKLGDVLGRKRVYGFTLVLMIVSSIGSALSFGHKPKAVMITLCFFRFWLGVGIGGDYPLSATIMSEYANTRTRGGFIAAVFAMQGFGILVAGMVAMIVASFFSINHHIPSFEVDARGSTPPSADYIWRIVFAFGAIPAALTFYWRMKMPETARYTALVEGNTKQAAADMARVLKVEIEAEDTKANVKQVEQFGLWSREFTRRHGLHLLGTTACWFLLDIAFYSQTLFQKDVFTSVGWLKPARELNAVNEVLAIAKAQVQLAAMSTVPGYWFTVYFIDKIGRFAIQLQGFFFMTVFMAAAAFPYDRLKKHACPTADNPTKECGNVIVFLALYALTFFFANFGPNSTTFIVPAEIFPARLRSTCHGISAGAGKVGAIIGSFGFFYMAQDPVNPDKGFHHGLGTKKALISLAAVNLCGLLFTFLVPETNQRSLEDLSRENEEVGAVVPPSRELSDVSSVFQRKKLGPLEETS